MLYFDALVVCSICFSETWGFKDWRTINLVLDNLGLAFSLKSYKCLLLGPISIDSICFLHLKMVSSSICSCLSEILQEYDPPGSSRSSRTSSIEHLPVSFYSALSRPLFKLEDISSILRISSTYLFSLIRFSENEDLLGVLLDSMVFIYHTYCEYS